MENYRQLYESMFNKKLEDNDARAWLESITKKYPFFSPAQFLLLQKTEKSDANYQQQVTKTVAAFNNNYWLNFLLIQKDKQDGFEESYSASETIADFKQDDVETIFIADNKPNSIAEPGLTDSDETTLDEADEESALDEAEEENAIENELIELGSPIELEEPLPATEEFETAAKDEAGEDPELEVDVEHMQELLETADDKKGEESIIAEDDWDSNENIAAQNEVNDTEPDNLDHLTDFTGKNDALFNAPLKTDLAEAAAILDTKPVENGPLFEPLHTTDYFASVGIKLSDEIKPGDKLGKQLKSFTEWLKTMKRLQPEQTAVLPETTEKVNNNIQQLAEKSNQDEEIITEAMADVLMQQGRIDKAVEVLKKLSLLNPSKNTYFAAKIDKLKE